MQAKKTISCNVDQQGILIPHPKGIFPVFLTKMKDSKDCATGTISWNNKVQAFVTFDTTGRIVVSYNCTDLTFTAPITQKSIENIIPFMGN